MKLLSKLLASDAPAATLLIRALVGGVFASEGVQKLLFPGDLGVGRFAKLSLPHPELLAPFIGSVEITCGIALLLGVATRLAAMPLLGVMAVALVKTKLPLLASKGAWAVAHEGRTVVYSKRLALRTLPSPPRHPCANTKTPPTSRSSAAWASSSGTMKQPALNV